MRVILLPTLGVNRRAEATRLKHALGVPLIVPAELLCAAMAARTPLGLEAGRMLAAGVPLADGIMLGMLDERLAEPDVRAGFIVDGYPRTLAQAQALDALLARRQQPVDAVVQLEVDEELMIQRLMDVAGADAEGADVIRARLRELDAGHAPVAEHYRIQGKRTALEALITGVSPNG